MTRIKIIRTEDLEELEKKVNKFMETELGKCRFIHTQFQEADKHYTIVITYKKMVE